MNLRLSTLNTGSNLANLLDFVEKIWLFFIQSQQFSLWNGYLEDEPAPTDELQPADEENATFSQQNPEFSSNSTPFLRSKVAHSWRMARNPWRDLGT